MPFPLLALLVAVTWLAEITAVAAAPKPNMT
jgi:hypothetical protein